MPMLIDLTVAAATALAATCSEAGQAGCSRHVVERGDIRSARLELYAPVAEPREPRLVITRDEAPERFQLTDCQQPYLLWRRDGTPYFIERAKIDPVALGLAATCRCPERRAPGTGRRAAAPGIGIPLCPQEQCS